MPQPFVGKVIRLNEDYLRVVRRLCIAHYHWYEYYLLLLSSPSWCNSAYLPRLEDVLLPAILEGIHRVENPLLHHYKASRKPVFKTRQELLQYEEMLMLEERVHALVVVLTSRDEPLDLESAGGEITPTEARTALIDVWNSEILPPWRSFVKGKLHSSANSNPWLRRFEPGWIDLVFSS